MLFNDCDFPIDVNINENNKRIIRILIFDYFSNAFKRRIKLNSSQKSRSPFRKAAFVFCTVETHGRASLQKINTQNTDSYKNHFTFNIFLLYYKRESRAKNNTFAIVNNLKALRYKICLI